jgi:hypothetical protein
MKKHQKTLSRVEQVRATSPLIIALNASGPVEEVIGSLKKREIT